MAEFLLTFDKDTGTILSVGREHGDNFIQIAERQAIEFLNLEKNTIDYHVVWKNKKHTLEEKAKVQVSESIVAMNDHYQIPENNKDCNLIFTQDEKNNKWIITANDDFITEVTKSQGLFQNIFVTAKNNPNVYYGTIRVDFDFLKNKKELVIESMAGKNCSLYCKNVYNNYQHVRM